MYNDIIKIIFRLCFIEREREKETNFAFFT